MFHHNLLSTQYNTLSGRKKHKLNDRHPIGRNLLYIQRILYDITVFLKVEVFLRTREQQQ